MRYFMAVILAAAALLGVGAAAVSARTYTVVSCRDQSGRPAVANDAWGGWQPIGTGYGRDATDLCTSSSPRLEAIIGGPWSFPVGTILRWRFTPPPDTYLAAWRFAYSGYTKPWDGQNQGVIQVGGSDSGVAAVIGGVGNVAVDTVSRSAVHDRWADLLIACDGPTGFPDCAPNQVDARVTMSGSDMTVADETPPDAGGLSGNAVASSTWQGPQLFAFAASDKGGGVYQAIVDVDGRTMLVRTIDEWGGRCVDTAAGGQVFRFPQPCPTSVDALLPVDANALPTGEHDVTLRISDAAGNLRTVYSARKTIVAPARTIGPGSDPSERGVTNGENASDAAHLTARWTRTKRLTLVGPYGRRQVIRGRLSDRGGAGIRGARIELLTAIDVRNGAPIDKGGARTRGDGRFTLILPRNVSSRTLMLRYRSHVNDTVAVAERSLRLKVKAGVKLTVRPRVTGRGRTVRLTGQLVSRPVPRGGKVVEFQARSPGEKWITFRTVRASRAGRFSTRYTFRRGGPALYLMRARVRAAADYPYASGSSHSVRVRVR
jgi:hypothetical protein